MKIKYVNENTWILNNKHLLISYRDINGDGFNYYIYDEFKTLVYIGNGLKETIDWYKNVFDNESKITRIPNFL